MNEGVNITVEIDPHRIQRRIDTGYIDMKTNSLDEAISLAFDAKESGQPLSIGLLGNCAEVYPEILNRGIIPDIVTDQTSAHDELTGYIPNGLSYMDAKKLRENNPNEYIKKSYESMAIHCQAMIDFSKRGSVTF